MPILLFERLWGFANLKWPGDENSISPLFTRVKKDEVFRGVMYVAFFFVYFHLPFQLLNRF